MALHSKWTSGDLTFYDGTQDVFKIQDNDEGVEIGEDEGGVDAKFFGGTASAYMLWDANVDDLLFAGGAGLALSGGDILLGDGDYLNFGASKDMTMRWTTGDVFEVLPAAAKSDVYLGSATLPVDVKFFGTTGSTEYMQWQSTGHALVFDQADISMGDEDIINFGDTPDILMTYDGDSFNITADAANAPVQLGTAAKPLNITYYGTSGGTDTMKWESSGSRLVFSGADIALADADYIKFGGAGEVTVNWTTGNALEVLPNAAHLPVELGSATVPLNIKFFTTGTAFMQWNSSGNVLDIDGADITLGNTDSVKLGDSDEFAIAYDGDSLNIIPTAANAPLEIGSATLPVDVKFFGTTGTSAFMQWKPASNVLDIDEASITLGDDDFIKFGDDDEVTIDWTTAGVLEILPTAANAEVEFGSTGKPLKVKFFGTTGTLANMQWESSGARLVFDLADIEMGDADFIKFGDANEMTMRWTTGDTFEIIPSAANADMELGNTSAPLDVKFFGTTGSVYMQWVSTGDKLNIVGADITLGDNDYIKFGDDGDITLTWDTDSFNFVPISANANAYVEFGTVDIPLRAKFFGTSGGTASMIWNSTSSELIFEQSDISIGDSDYIKFGDADEITMRWTTGDAFEILPTGANSEVYLGSTEVPLKVKFFGTTGTSANMQWESSGARLVFDLADISIGDADYIKFGDSDEVTMRWTTGDAFEVIPTAAHAPVELGSATLPLNVKFFTTGADFIQWDSSGSVLNIDGADITLGNTDSVKFGDSDEFAIAYDGSNLDIIPTSANANMELGTTTYPIDVKFFTTGAAFMQWVSSGSVLDIDGASITLGDDDHIKFGDSDEVAINWTTADVLEVLPTSANAEVELGSTNAPLKVKFFGTTGTAANMQWESSGARLVFDLADISIGDADYIKFGDSDEVTMRWTTGDAFEVIPTDANANVYLGSTSKPLKIKFFGTTGTTANAQWESSGSRLVFDLADIEMGDADYIKFGDANEITARWTTGDAFEVLPADANSEVYLGSTDVPLKVKFFGTSGTAANMQWDSSGAELIFDLADISMGDTDYIKFGDDDDFTIACSTGNVLQIIPAVEESDINFGSTAGNLSVDINIYGNDANHHLKWVSASDELDVTATIEMQTTEKIQFYDTNHYINAATTGRFDIVTDGTLYLNGEVTYPTPESQTSTGSNITLTVASNRIQFLTSTGNFNVLVPTSSGTGVAGVEFKILNSTGGICSVYETSTGGALVASIAAGDGGSVISNATDWRSLGTT